jgi:hypothetical protein
MGGFYVGECPHISPFLKNNGHPALLGPRLKSTHCTLLILLIINLVTKKSLCIVSKVQSIKLFALCGTSKVQREQYLCCKSIVKTLHYF